MAAWVFEAASYPRVRNEIKKTKLHRNTEPQADICTLLGAGRVNRYFSQDLSQVHRYEIVAASSPREQNSFVNCYLSTSTSL